MRPDLPERFLPPNGWKTGIFRNDATGHTLHYGHVFPATEKPITGAVVCLGGLSEFSEKYFELARDMLARGHAFFFMDWHYQGRSGRLDTHPHRRHSDGFDADLSDLDHFIKTIVMVSLHENSHAGSPLFMIGHSMGGHLGLRYLAENPSVFSAAAFSSPFFGIYNFGAPLLALAWIVRHMNSVIGKRYVFSGRDWHEAMRKSDGGDIFSSDPARDSVHNAWCRQCPELQVGSVTFGWVTRALASCGVLNDKRILSRITCPVLIALAGKEKIVDNPAAKKAAAQMPNAKLIEIACAHHEILMETDECRNVFLSEFDALIKNALSSTG